MECRLALTKTEQNAIMQQRYAVFVEEFPFFSPREDGQKIECDGYDDHAFFFGVWEKNTLIASCRLIVSDTLSGLPTFNSMTIDSAQLRSNTSTAEISRIIVVPGHRTLIKTIKILQTMQQEIHRVSAEYGIGQWIGAVEPGFLTLLNRARLPYRPIGPLQLRIHAKRYPVVLESHDYLRLKECP